MPRIAKSVKDKRHSHFEFPRTTALKLPLDYYLHEDVLFLSRDLLGKCLMTCIDSCVTGGIIVETEAYRAPDDRASHAYGYRLTPRNEAMYAEGGICYIYRCYGIHSLFNIVTHREGVPHAILIRSIQPTVGVDTMLKRRRKENLCRAVAGGPGMLTQALGIDDSYNKTSLASDFIWLEDQGVNISPQEIVSSPRVGVDYAGEDALLPWRFRIKNNPWTSPAK